MDDVCFFAKIRNFVWVYSDVLWGSILSLVVVVACWLNWLIVNFSCVKNDDGLHVVEKREMMYICGMLLDAYIYISIHTYMFDLAPTKA